MVRVRLRGRAHSATAPAWWNVGWAEFCAASVDYYSGLVSLKRCSRGRGPQVRALAFVAKAVACVIA